MPTFSEAQNEGLRSELDTARAQIRRLQEANRHFTALLSHELRSPLTIILAYLRIWQEGEGIADREQLRVVVEQTRRLNRRLDELMMLDQLEAGLLPFEPRRMSLSEVANRLVREHADALAEKRLKCEVNLEPSPEPLVADREKIYIILGHLLSNAIKFSPVGAAIRIHAWQEGTRCLITVADEGIGISKEAQTRIFERFYQGDSSFARKYEGLGLGLALVKSLVAMHNGQIWLNSTPGSGSEFCVSLPIGGHGERGHAAEVPPYWLRKTDLPAVTRND